MDAVPSGGIHRDDTSENSSLSTAINTVGEGWKDELFTVLSVTEGPDTGIRAVGVGSNVKKRTRAAKVALALSLELRERRGVSVELDHAVEDAACAIAAADAAGSRCLIHPSPHCLIPPSASRHYIFSDPHPGRRFGSGSL